MKQDINFLVALLSVLVLVYVLLFAWSIKRFASICRHHHNVLRSNLQLQSSSRRVQTAVFLSLALATFLRTICFGVVAGFCWRERVNPSGLQNVDESVCDPFNGDFMGHFGYLLFTSPSLFIDLTYIMLFNLLIIVWMRTKAVHQNVYLDIVQPRLVYSTIAFSVLYFLVMSILIIVRFEQKHSSNENSSSVLIAQGASVLFFCFIAVLGLLIMRCFVRDIDYRSPMSRIRCCRTVKAFAWWTCARMTYGFGMVFYTSATSWAMLATHGNFTSLIIVIGIVMCFATEILPAVLIVQRGFFHLLVQIDDMEIQDEQFMASPNVGSDHSEPSQQRCHCGLTCIMKPGDSLPSNRATHWASRNFVKAVALSLDGHEYLTPRDTKRLGSLRAGVDPCSHSRSSVAVRIMSGKQLPSRFIMQECLVEAKRLVNLSHPHVVPLVAFVPEAPLMQAWRTQSACWIVTGGNARCSLYAYLHSTSRFNHDSSSFSASNVRLGYRESCSRRTMLLNAVSHYCGGGFRRGDNDALRYPRQSRMNTTLWDAFKWDSDTGQNLNERGQEKLRCRVRLFRQIADGMAYLHTWDIAHGHLSPHNILIQETDPEEAPSLQIADAGFHGLKRYASLVGTYEMRNPWSAPEILSESRTSFEKESDVYTLGLLLWELMTSQEPFLGLTLGAITKAVNDKQRPEVPQATSALEGALNSLIHGCWQHEPSKRMPCVTILSEINDIEMRFR